MSFLVIIIQNYKHKKCFYHRSELFYIIYLILYFDLEGRMNLY